MKGNPSYLKDTTKLINQLNELTIPKDTLLRPVHTTKIMRIKSELIRIVTVHTECTLTAIWFEFTFSQSTSIGGLKQDSLQITSFSRYCACSYNYLRD